MIPAATAQADRKTTTVRYDTQIEVVTEGAGQAIVLLPSRGRHSHDFDPVAAGLAAAGFRVLRPQPRGIGASAGRMRDLTLHDLATDVAATIEQQADGPAIIVGHAFGGAVARMTAVDHPKLVAGIVLAATAAKGPTPYALGQALGIASDTSRPQAERLQALQYGFFASGHDASAWLDGWSAAASAAQGTALANTRQEDWWSAGATRILDLQGGRDPWRPLSTGGELRSELGDRVAVRIIFEASHALLPEQPVAVVEAIVSWIGHL